MTNLSWTRISPVLAVFFAVHSRYTMFNHLLVLQGLGERPEPCKHNMFQKAAILSLRYHGLMQRRDLERIGHA